MQIQKEDSKERILKVAKEEFLIKGFKDASMRVIAKKSGIGLSNIYNYFRNKDEIFCEVMSSVLAAFRKMADDHNAPEHINLNVFTNSDFQHIMINDFLGLINKHRQELKLLLFYSHGSSLENFKEEFIQESTETGKEYLQKMKEKYSHLNSNISPFFLHTISSVWMNVIGEIVTHDELLDSEVEDFIREYIAFSTAGWKKLMKA
jgi:AcrR family transcriptional regulator